ncbi:hypothetical protein H6788_00865 [Candidatus Nomurabacteria bacterium]|nr:hypothetical protein [Candidatus Nomurabacteria bacterium]MCB9819370.1 hypothetical protein [Candidatus Nomurabacteria bacterium]
MASEGTSFIPKSGVKTVQRTKSTRRIYILAYISYIVFFSTLFSVIGVYAYGAIVNRDVSSLRDQLVVERQRFSLGDIESIKQLHKRLATAEALLNNSSAPSRIFDDIEAIVASNIYFSGMHYQHLPNNKFQIDLTGRADNFTEIISQRNLLGNSSLLKEAKVIEYDYSIGGGEGGTNNLLGSATLSFVFSDTRDISSIAYQPAQETGVVTNVEVGEDMENIVIIDSATSTTDSVAPPVTDNEQIVATSTVEVNQ